jgi:septum formation topological specificity factor MinE
MSKLEKMVHHIDNFSKEDHIKILEILVNYDRSIISENSNGCFIHMEDLSEDIIEKIQHYINYVLLKESEISQVETTKDILKNNINIKTS